MFKLLEKRRIKHALGLIIALMALVWAFADVDAAALSRSLWAAHWAWVGAAVASVFLSVAVIVVRWWFLLDRPRDAASGRAPWAILWHATMAAHVANIIVPFRMGDGVRVVAASQTLGLGPVRASSAVVLERLADVAALGAVTAIVIAAGAVPEWARAAVMGKSRLALAAVVIGAVGIGVGLWLRRRHVAVVPGRSALAWALLLSVAVPLSSALTNVLMVRAFDLPVPVAASFVLLVVLQAGTSIVAVPGGLGVSQVLTVKTLALWHIAAPEALAFALVLYAVSRVPKLLLMPFAMAAVNGSPQNRTVS